MTTERQAVIESPVWPFMRIEHEAAMERFRARYGDLSTQPLAWSDWQLSVRHLRGVWNLYYWLRQVQAGAVHPRELRRRLTTFLQDSRRIGRTYPEGDGDEFLLRVTSDLATLVGRGMGPYAVDAMAPGRIGMRRAPRTLLERMYGDLFSAMATRMEAAECGASGCSVVFLRSDPRRQFCGPTCKSREAKRAQRARADLTA